MAKNKSTNPFIVSVVIILGIIVAIILIRFDLLNIASLSTGKLSSQIISFLKNNDNENNPEEKLPVFISPLTGEELTEDLSQITPVAVVIDNNVESWPPFGISRADIIYEFPVEGGITRFLAIFHSRLPEKIGPVRSLRLAFLEVVNEYQAVLAYCGGDSRALQKVSSGAVKVKTLDQMRYSGYYWREKNRIAPYNLFTSQELLEKAKKDRNWELLDTPLIFLNFGQRAQEKGQISRIEAKNTFPYNVHWLYQVESNKYQRYQGGAPHQDKLNQEIITADNLLFIITTGKVADKLGHFDLKLTGEGKAILFKDGSVITGKWTKNSANERMVVVDSEGQEVTLNPGKTFISVIIDEGRLKY